jgi:hypothetical protein
MNSPQICEGINFPHVLKLYQVWYGQSALAGFQDTSALHFCACSRQRLPEQGGGPALTFTQVPDSLVVICRVAAYWLKGSQFESR